MHAGHQDEAPADIPAEPQPRQYVRTTGSVSRRMLLVAIAWILLLLVGGGYALDRVLVTTVTRNFDDQLDYVLKAMIFTAEIDSNGEVMNNRELADQRFLEYNSGAYWQISGKGHEPYIS
ncbi:MAG: histidine kinase, partial [Sphingomonadales bacterium]